MRCAGLAAVLAALVLAGGAHAQSFAEADGDIDRRLKQGLAELSRLRGEIAREKIPLSKKTARLEDEVVKLRAERDRLLKSQANRDVDLATLRRRVDAMSGQSDFVDSRLSEFIREFEGRLDISELPLYEALTAAALLADRDVDLDIEGKREAQLRVAEVAIARLREQVGGHVFEGEALGPDGILEPGTFVALGPTVFFASEDGSVAGLVESRLNAADPVVVALPGDAAAGIVALAREGRGPLPFDATLGKALKQEKARKGLLEYVADGGMVGYVILLLGAAALLLTAFKCVEILGFPVAEADEVDEVLHRLASGDPDGAARRADEIEGVAGQMLTTGVIHAQEKRGILEEMLFETILKVRPTLERYLPFLAITAAAAPLLGLLGTVIGMIKTFQLITIFGTGDAKSLSSGISEALVTTALGLIVAIPTLILHGALSRMAKRKLGLLEQLSVAFVNGVSSIAGRAPVPVAPRRGGDA